MPEVDCDWCGEEHHRYPSRMKDGEMFCSQECRISWQQKDNHYEPCATCGDEVKVPPSRRTGEYGDYHLENHFCDKECEREYRQENWVGEDHPNWDGGEAETTCEVCEDTYTVKPANKDNSRFCSMQCQCKNMVEARGSQAGSNNPAWKGGCGGIEAVRRKLSDDSWRDIAERVRDGECRLCGCEGGKQRLAVHHIIPIASGGTHDTWNLIPLCHSCHRKAERYTKEFTEPHLLKFVK